MYNPEQITVLEMLITIIQEHESKLDTLITRLEDTQRLSLKQYLETQPNL